ncbi:CPBP family intramembrane glutamic endopeptidase, partial [Dermatophilus congolensis]
MHNPNTLPQHPLIGLPASHLPSRTLRTEMWLVIGVSIGASALRAILSITERLTRDIALSAQTSNLNTPVTPDRPWLDLAYQLLRILLLIIPALLALHLMRRDDTTTDHRIGWHLHTPANDLALGTVLATCIGIPGLGLYLGAKALNINTTVSAASLGDHWWSIPILILASLANAICEEIILIGYLFTRWEQARNADRLAKGKIPPTPPSEWIPAARAVLPILILSALLRGTYHLYQGFGGFIGNICMGLILGTVYARTHRVLPIVIAHALIDIVAFIGYTFLAG